MVTGKGEISETPDIATFTLSVTEESLSIKTAQDKATETTKAILAFLRKEGIEDKDIHTSGYNIYPRYEYPKSFTVSGLTQYGKQILVAYVVSQSVTVKVRDLANAGKVIGGIGEIGATDVSGLSFDFDKRDALEKQARDKAIKEARAEADNLAKSLGVSLVRIVSYNENNFYPGFAKVMMAESSGRGGDAGFVSPEIPIGESTITSNVTITYEVK